MPFDVTHEKTSFQIVSRVGGTGVVATHWSYWAADCRHLVDVFVCLTPKDTTVMDAHAVQGSTQIGSKNQVLGPIADLKGERGIIFVTAYDADVGSSAEECRPRDPSTPSAQPALVGAWTIADTATNAGFGDDAIGIPPDALPDPTRLDGGLFITTFNPERLASSEVVLMGVQTASGSGAFSAVEPGPISAALPNGAHVCCNLEFVDNLEVAVSLPDVCFDCVGFQPISTRQALPADVPLIPPTVTPASSGFLRLTNCASASLAGAPAPLGTDRPQFLFAFHLQAVGPFGGAFSGKYAQ
jgi:hypothetical protein